RIHWNTVKCLTSPQVVGFANCNIFGPDQSLISTEFQFNRDLTQIRGTFIMHLPRPPSKEFHKIVDINFDVCQFCKTSSQNKFLAIAYQSMKKDSNFPCKCPISKVGFHLILINSLTSQHIFVFQGFYYIHNMDIGANVPLFIPKNSFKIVISFSQPELSILNISLSGFL
ncbi:hypothetical protein KR093_003388, partial [Drosophila rubida]